MKASVHSHVLSRVNSQPDVPPPNLQPQFEYVLFIALTRFRKLCVQLKGSVSNKENTSIVIIGPKSSGKSLLVDCALKNLFASFPNQKFKLCNIRGQYIQTEAGCVTTVKNELKHVGINEDAAARFDEEEEDVDDSEEKLGQNMETLTSQIIELSRKGYCLIFVMDDFHVISQVAKKAVYHIADTSHMNNVTSIMIGITPSTTININLDRRIKSRFLNRQLYTFLPKNVPQVCDFFRYYLTLPVDPRAKIRKLVTEEYIQEFNSHLNECLEDRQIQSLFLTSLTKSSNNFYKSWMKFLLLAVKREQSEWFTVEDFLSSYARLTLDGRLEMIRDLTQLEMRIFFTIKKIEQVGEQSYTFDTIFARYMRFVTNSNTTDIDSKDRYNSKLVTVTITDKNSVYNAFQHLLDLQLIKFASRVSDKKKHTTNVRLNELHPSEIENWVRKNEHDFNTEVYQYATEN